MVPNKKNQIKDLKLKNVVNMKFGICEKTGSK